MNHAKQLESDSVVTAEIYWQRGRARFANQAHSGFIPLWVGNLRGG
jgi:hypothetical protein